MATKTIRDLEDAYAPGEERPLGSYAILQGAFGTIVVGALAALSRAGRTVPPRMAPADLALTAVATHKLARILAKDRITSVIRAPFTRYQGPAGPSEVSEEPRGTGFRRAAGELAVCPYCLAPWVAALLMVLHTASPRYGRFVTSLLTVVAASDVLQQAYHAAQERA
jgi:hypothetical protein